VPQLNVRNAILAGATGALAPWLGAKRVGAAATGGHWAGRLGADLPNVRTGWKADSMARNLDRHGSLGR